MPSVTNPNKVDKSTLPDPHQEPLSKVQLLVDNKIRNLEKRKSRLEQYRDEAKAGKELNHDQKKAVKRYEEVTEMLDFFREFKKNVQSIFADHAKQMKKLARKERPARDPKEIERLRLVFLFQDLLGNLNGEVKNDLIKGTNGAIQLTEDKIQHLEEFSKIVDSERNKVEEGSKQHTKTAERYLALVEGIRSDAVKGASYKELKETLTSISESGYFEKSTSISVITPAVVSKSSLSSTSQPQQPQVTETGNLSRVTDEDELSRPNFESSPIQVAASNDSQASVKQDISGGNKYQSQPSHQAHHQNKHRNSNSNQPGMNEMLGNVAGGPGVGVVNPVVAPSNSYNFLQESRLEMENAPHMDPAVVAMAPVAGAYSAAYGNNQSVEALAAQFASTGIPPMSSVNNMTKGVSTFETTGPTHQPIPTQTFTNQRFTAMMTGGTFVQPVPIANPSLLGLPVQLTGQTMTSHPTGSNEQMTSNQPNNDNNQAHAMTMANLGQSMAGYGPEANFTQYQAPHPHDNSRNNQGPSRDKSSYQGDDSGNQVGYGSNYGRYRRGGGRGGGGGGDRSSGPPRTNKYNSVNGYTARGRGGGQGIRSSGKPQDNKPKNISDNRNVSNQWS